MTTTVGCGGLVVVFGTFGAEGCWFESRPGRQVGKSSKFFLNMLCITIASTLLRHKSVPLSLASILHKEEGRYQRSVVLYCMDNQ